MLVLVKFPPLVRFTIVLGVFALVAALARTTPEATLAAVCPPTVATVVAFCHPVTSPASEPEKLMAVIAFVAIVAVREVLAATAAPATAALVAVPALPVMLMLAVPGPTPEAGTLPAVVAVAE
jgi:hypothetical protein